MLKKSLLITLMFLGVTQSPQMAASCATNCASPCTSSCKSLCDDSNSCACPCGGKTFFFNRPLFQSYRPELWASFRNDVMAEAPDSTGGALDIVLYGSQSTNACNLAQYFLPDCKNSLVVREKVVAGDNTDLQAHNFGIFTVEGINPDLPGGFESVVSFDAKHTEAGVGLHWKQGFGFNDDLSQWCYLDITLPITYVRNQFNIYENIISDGGGIATTVAAAGIPVSADMTIAMQQSAWNYGKVSNCCKLSRTGIADMEVKLGRQFVYNNKCMFAAYFGILIPTGNTPCGTYIFEPVVGHGKSFGIIWGTEGGYNIWRNCDRSWNVWLDYAWQSLYLLSTCQIRSFDLKNKPWSRYLSVYRDQSQATQASALADPAATYLSTPGINVFTQQVQVRPGFQTNATTSVVFEQDTGFTAELGYNAFFRSAECIDLDWHTGPAIKGSPGAGSTNPTLNIQDTPLLDQLTLPLANYNFSLIQESDINIQSAAHPNIIVQLLYGQLGFRLDNRCNAMDFGVGASYEFAVNNFAVMNRWALWAKFGFAF